MISRRFEGKLTETQRRVLVHLSQMPQQPVSWRTAGITNLKTVFRLEGLGLIISSFGNVAITEVGYAALGVPPPAEPTENLKELYQRGRAMLDPSNGVPPEDDEAARNIVRKR